MTDFTPDQEILKEMAGILGRIAPGQAQEVVFHGKLYDDFTEGAVLWVDAEGTEQAFPQTHQPEMATLADLLDLGESLQTTPAFAASPFTQFEVRLNRLPEVTLNTVDIPADQSWTGLFMQPVSALTREQAEALHISEEDWAACQQG